MLSVAPLTYLISSQTESEVISWFDQLEDNSIYETENTGNVENEWIIQLNQDALNTLTSVSKVADYLNDYGVTVLAGLGLPGLLHVRMNADTPELQYEILAGISGLDYWEQNYVANSNSVTEEVNDLFAELQWYLDTINILPAWEKTTGEGVVVAVLDSGIQLDHPDLQANIWTNPKEIPDNGIDDDGDGLIDDIHGWDMNSRTSDISDNTGHGTQVAGIIGAVGNNNIGITGIAPNVQILPVKVGKLLHFHQVRLLPV